MKFKVFFAAILLTALTIPQAQAADTGWRYWGYFQAAPGATKWTPAMTGPTVDVADGAVEGWAFTFSNDAIPDAKAPKVALIQRCVVADKGALGIDVLGQVVKVRAQGSGFICGLNGYPAKECGVEMKTPKGYLKK